MAFTLIAHTGKGSGVAGGSVQVLPTTPINTVGAKLLLASTAVFSFLSPTLVDSADNVWTPLNPASGVLGGVARLWYCINPKTSATHTFELVGSSVTYPALCIQAFSTSGAVAFVNQSGNPTSGSTLTAQPGPLSATGNGQLFVTAVVGGSDTGHVTSIDSSFTISDSVDHLSLYNLALGMGYLIQGTAGTVNPMWTGTDFRSSCMALFQEVAAPVTLSVASVAGVKGGTVSVDISITSQAGANCVALQFSINLTSDVALASVAPGAAAIAASKALNTAGLLIVIGGFNDNVIGDGVIITLTLDIVDNPSTGSIPVGIMGLIAVQADGTVLSSTTIPGLILISQPVVTCPVAGGSGLVGVAYSKTLLVSGGTPPYTYSVS